MNERHLNANTAETETITLPIRIDKTLQWLTESRDSWKEKTKTSKAKLKITTLALKRARKDREQCITKLKQERRNTQKQLHQKDDEIAILKEQLGQAKQEVENLKKRR